VEIAKNFLAEIVDINDYDMTVEEEVERGFYIIKFTKEINGLKTTDSARIVVKKDGSLYSYSSFMLGRVNENLISDYTIDLDLVHESVENRLDQIYQEAKNIYSRIEYGEPDILLTVTKDGEVGIVYTVCVDCIQEVGGGELNIGDRITFIVLTDGVVDGVYS
jgi:hypothetical protein